LSLMQQGACYPWSDLFVWRGWREGKKEKGGGGVGAGLLPPVGWQAALLSNFREEFSEGGDAILREVFEGDTSDTVS